MTKIEKILFSLPVDSFYFKGSYAIKKQFPWFRDWSDVDIVTNHKVANLIEKISGKKLKGLSGDDNYNSPDLYEIRIEEKTLQIFIGMGEEVGCKDIDGLVKIDGYYYDNIKNIIKGKIEGIRSSDENKAKKHGADVYNLIRKTKQIELSIDLTKEIKKNLPF